MTAADPGAECAAIERGITRLVREAPALDAAVLADLIAGLRRVGSPLALSIARVVELVGEELIAPGPSLPHLAMACETLAGGVAGRLPASALEAARFEIETLLPVPDGPRMRVIVPDVPAARLASRGPRRRT